MVDLSRQLNSIKVEVDSAIQNVLKTTNFIQGQPVREFEYNLGSWINSKHIISCANGTDALQLAPMTHHLLLIESFIMIFGTQKMELNGI